MYEEVVVPPPPLSAEGVFDSQPDFLKKSLNRERWFWRRDTPDKYQRNIKGYYRMISGIDQVMGRVLAALTELGFEDDTVIIFSSDNGYYLGSRGFAGKWSHCEESLRVPLIVFDPRVRAESGGREVESMALNVDIAATILELADVDVPASYQGRGLVPLLEGERPRKWRSEFFAEHLMEAGARIPKWEGVRGERWVYARYFERRPRESGAPVGPSVSRPGRRSPSCLLVGERASPCLHGTPAPQVVCRVRAWSRLGRYLPRWMSLLPPMQPGARSPSSPAPRRRAVAVSRFLLHAPRGSQTDWTPRQ